MNDEQLHYSMGGSGPGMYRTLCGEEVDARHATLVPELVTCDNCKKEVLWELVSGNMRGQTISDV